MILDKNLARIAGFCYLVVIATGLFSEVFVRQALRVSNDALATASIFKIMKMSHPEKLVPLKGEKPAVNSV